MRSLWFLLLLEVVSWAQAPAASLDEKARVHFRQGVALFGDKAYAAALAEFEASYRDRPVAAVLHNIALTYHALHQYAKATDSMDRFLLQAGPELTAEARAESQRLLVEWRALLGQIVVAPTPPGAIVQIDGEPASGGAVRLGPGPHDVEVTAPGHEAARRHVVIAAGEVLRVEVQLKALPTTGHLHVEGEPEGAVLWIDGIERGRLPQDGDLAAGTHHIEVRREGFVSHREGLALAVGEQRTLQLVLQRGRPPAVPLHRRWWLWTGMTVLAGGIVVAAVVPTQTKTTPDPYVGTFMPGVFQLP